MLINYLHRIRIFCWFFYKRHSRVQCNATNYMVYMNATSSFQDFFSCLERCSLKLFFILLKPFVMRSCAAWWPFLTVIRLTCRPQECHAKKLRQLIVGICSVGYIHFRINIFCILLLVFGKLVMVFTISNVSDALSVS